jgi:DUF4097 and DUF4098 domain-containing protein YvlB
VDVVVETFEYSGVGELQVDGMFFTVEISGHTGNRVEGSITIPQILYDGDYVEVNHTKSGDVLNIEVKKKRASHPPFPGAAIISIRSPHDTDIDLRTSSGKITVVQFESDTVSLKSSSGKIMAKDLNARINITSSSGFQDIQLCKGSLNIQSSSGKVSVRDVEGNVSVESSSGSQTFEEIDGNIKAKSSSGSITINNQTGVLALKATSGRLEGRGVKLTGNSSFQTYSGKINFEFINDFSEFSFDLQSSSGILRVGESKVKGTLIMGSGPITITGKSSSGSQEYR